MLHIFCYSSGLSKGSPNWFFYRCVYGSPLQGLHRKGVRSSPVSISWIELVSCSAHRRRDTWLGLRSVGCGRRWQGQAAIASSTDCSNNKGWSPFDTGGETAWQRRGHPLSQPLSQPPPHPPKRFSLLRLNAGIYWFETSWLFLNTKWENFGQNLS